VKIWLVIVAAAAVLAVAAFAGSRTGVPDARQPTTAAPTLPPEVDTEFYSSVTPEETAQDPPGTLLDVSDALRIPEGADGWRILYRSTDSTGQPIVVSGLVMRPEGEAPPGGFPLVSWGHSTVGLSDVCTPSLDGPPPGLDSAAVLDAGYAIVATDYEGMGPPGVHPYLDGESAARSMLDAARAARSMSDLEATGDVALWGYSQGGHATLHAAQRAADYAPELPIVGAVAAAAPASPSWFNLSLFSPDRYQFAAMAALAWAEVKPELDAATVLGPAAIADTDRMLGRVGEGCPDMSQLTDQHSLLDLVRAPFDSDPAWDAAVRATSIGPAPASMPVLLFIGEDDDIVPPVEAFYASAQLCSAGSEVDSYVVPEGTHLVGLLSDVPLEWLAERRDGRQVLSDCPPATQ
jgi:pimeloyl-ACP methyl ester carboxylesterase